MEKGLSKITALSYAEIEEDKVEIGEYIDNKA